MNSVEMRNRALRSMAIESQCGLNATNVGFSFGASNDLTNHLATAGYQGYPLIQTIGYVQPLEKHMSGDKPVVICNGQTHECDDLNAAQAKAETLAHQHSADAYILKPIKKVSPKRDVVTTDL